MAPQFLHDFADDAGAGQDHCGAIWLNPNDRTTGFRVHRSKQLDLTVDLVQTEVAKAMECGLLPT